MEILLSKNLNRREEVSKNYDSFKVSGVIKKEKIRSVRSITSHIEKLVRHVNLTIENLDNEEYLYFLSGNEYISGRGQVEALLDIVISFHK